MSDKPNVILIFTDQWRGDCLSIDGHPVVRTPFLDQLALEGVRMSNAYTAVPSCIAARAGLFTGRKPVSHGRVGYRDGVNWDYETTIAGEFTNAGYQTQSVGKMHVYPARSQCGFQAVDLHDGYLHYGRKFWKGWFHQDDYINWLSQQLGRPADYFEHGLSCNSNVARPWDKDEYLHPTNWVATRSIDFLRRRDPRKPFFLFMSFHRPHPPYDPPAWAFEQYMNEDLPGVPVGDWVDYYADKRSDSNPTAQFSVPPPDVLRRARAGYYGHMSHIDQQVNRFIEALVDFDIDLDNTWIMFSSDHGELMGDHHMFRKAYPYQGSIRIPMILKGPRDCGLDRGSSCTKPVELRDVMPTLLDCAGLSVPDCVEGRSLLPYLRGETDEWREYLHGEHTCAHGSAMYLTDGREKYVWLSGDGHEQLFDLEKDPQELHDLASDPANEPRVARWRRRMVEELRDREEGFTDGEQLIPGRPVSPVLSHLR